MEGETHDRERDRDNNLEKYQDLVTTTIMQLFIHLRLLSILTRIVMMKKVFEMKPQVEDIGSFPRRSLVFILN